MPPNICTSRSLISLTQSLRQCRLERQQMRGFAELAVIPSDNQPLVPVPEITSFPSPSPGFRPSQAIRQNRHEDGWRKIREYPRARSTIKACPDPIAKITQDQLAVLDPTGARTRLFARDNPDRVKPGDILLVRLKSGEPFSGVCLSIRQIHSKIDWAILLRSNLTRVAVEMWYKVYSPNIEGIEIVQRRAKRARRARLYYMRKPKHDIGSVEGIVRQYNMTKAGITLQKKGGKKGSKKKR
ncbi:hypothetical protein AMS68_007097 [Peltaster fructicola]|uniref:Ribosomal protein L19 n=1 Tax=Peltaster fructicola TaxID=286661 RepID=A0A6H0Y4P4_9PEZI|nr:hypothetical protein AMS68_007097 [Peltaster fructicola]